MFILEDGITFGPGIAMLDAVERGRPRDAKLIVNQLGFVEATSSALALAGKMLHSTPAAHTSPGLDRLFRKTRRRTIGIGRKAAGIHRGLTGVAARERWLIGFVWSDQFVANEADPEYEYQPGGLALDPAEIRAFWLVGRLWAVASAYLVHDVAHVVADELGVTVDDIIGGYRALNARI